MGGTDGEPKLLPLAGQAARASLALAWLVGSQPTARWMVSTLGHPDFRLNLGLFAVAVGLLAASAWPRVRDRRAPKPAPLNDDVRIGPVVVVVVSSLLEAVARAAWSIDHLSAVLCGLGAWGVIGLWQPAERWKRSLAPALLLVAVLPFGEQIEGLFGFWARSATAEGVAWLLAPFGIGGGESVLVFEGRISHVDLPCAGLRSLWAAGLLFLAFTWLQQRRLSSSWLLAGAVYGLLALLANGLRVLILTVVGVALGLEDLAAWLHVPLGLAGFAAASAALVGLARLSTNKAAEALASPQRARASSSPLRPLRPAAVWSTAAAGVLGLALFPGEGSAGVAPARPAEVIWTFPSTWSWQPIELSAAEEDLFFRQGAQAVVKVRFERSDPGTGPATRGSLLIVRSPSFRAHHPPEVCYAGAGHRVEHSAVRTFGNHDVRALSLDGGSSLGIAWFQAGADTTPFLMDRALRGVRDRRPWSLVSLLVDGDVEERELAALVEEADAVVRALDPVPSLEEVKL